MLQVLIKNIKYSKLVFEIPKYFCNFTQKMSEALSKVEIKKQEQKKEKNSYKLRYDGRTKRRNWVDFTSSDDSKRVKLEPGDRIKRKKCLILLGYSGVNYYGMQRNPEMDTIEEEILKAMLKTQWITDDAFKQAQTIHFQRAARTDKGVSAARQCVSLKLPDNVDVDTLNSALPEQIRIFCVKRVTKGFNSKDQCNARTYTYTLPTIAFANQNETVEMETYRVPEERINEINNILKLFEGTKNFHNFTSRKEYLDPSSKRFIMSFTCDVPFTTNNNVEFAVIKVKGQSFMLHQIRKMIGLSLAIIQGHTKIETIERALTEERIDIPMSPGLNLVLDQVHYDRYNQRYGVDGIHEKLTFTEEEPKIKEFFEKFIVPTIVETEIKEKSMINWLSTLSLHSYDVRSEENSNSVSPNIIIDKENNSNIEDNKSKNDE